METFFQRCRTVDIKIDTNIQQFIDLHTYVSMLIAAGEKRKRRKENNEIY